MRVLITGAGGSLGSALADRLAGRHDLLLADVRPLETDHESLRVDVRDRDELIDVAAGADVIVHTPAWHGVHVDSRSETEFWEVNVDGTYNAFRAAVENDVPKVVWISSMAVHGADRIYGTTKVVGEEVCRYFNRVHDVRVIVLRPAAFAVPEGDRRRYGERLLRNAVDRRDVVGATATAVEDGTIDYGAYPVVRDDPFTAEEVERWPEDPVGVLEGYVPEAGRLVETYDLDLPDTVDPRDVASTKEELGYAPRHDFVTFLRDLAGRDDAGDAERWLGLD